MCIFFLVLFPLLFYGLACVPTILDRYHGHFCPYASVHAGYGLSRLLDTLRNRG
jgi:hypothetical protein